MAFLACLVALVQNSRPQKQKQGYICEFEVSLVYLRSSGQPELGSETLSLKKKKIDYVHFSLRCGTVPETTDSFQLPLWATKTSLPL